MPGYTLPPSTPTLSTLPTPHSMWPADQALTWKKASGLFLLLWLFRFTKFRRRMIQKGMEGHFGKEFTNRHAGNITKQFKIIPWILSPPTSRPPFSLAWTTATTPTIFSIFTPTSLQPILTDPRVIIISFNGLMWLFSFQLFKIIPTASFLIIFNAATPLYLGSSSWYSLLWKSNERVVKYERVVKLH